MNSHRVFISGTTDFKNCALPGVLNSLNPGDSFHLSLQLVVGVWKTNLKVVDYSLGLRLCYVPYKCNIFFLFLNAIICTISCKIFNTLDTTVHIQCPKNLTAKVCLFFHMFVSQTLVWCPSTATPGTQSPTPGFTVDGPVPIHVWDLVTFNIHIGW